MQELLASLCARYRPTVLMVTHDVDEALLLADRIVVMDDGALAHEVIPESPTPRARLGDEVRTLRERLLGMLGVR
jgi:sulfonate transport system ATP-binding protein